MSLPVVLTDEAIAEFDEAVDWYEQHAGIGSRLLDRIRAVLNQIGQDPELHCIVCEDVRRAIVPKFPYAILYRVRPDRVEVIAVFHGRRDPSEWRRRV